jgi:glycosyltransferase involved in cell wall biosynthesis
MNKDTIAWLLPSMGTNRRQGYPWHSVLSEFSKLFPNTTVFTGEWPGYAQGFENSFKVEVVGEFKFVETNSNTSGYSSGFSPLSAKIIPRLIALKPQVIFTCAFSLWTIFAIVLKPLFRWRIIIVYEGSSPGVDYQTSQLRLLSRRLIAQKTDAFITNNQAGKKYLTQVLGAKLDRVVARPFEIATPDLLLASFRNSLSEGTLNRELLTGNACGDESKSPAHANYERPIFIAVGQLIPRKNIQGLLQACVQLKQRGYSNYTVLVVGDGEQRQELEAIAQKYSLEDCVKWLGWIDYERLGAYFQSADVFVFPTLEDTWGLVTLEAMALGKPVICSNRAGTVEMIADEENGYIFDPDRPDRLADLMCRFIDRPELISIMGKKSQQIMASYTPKTVSKFLSEVVELAVNK